MKNKIQILYCTGQTVDGTLLIGGIYKMKDEVGFPIDLSILQAREKGYEIDWCELLADAGRQSDPNKFLDAMNEMGHVLSKEQLDIIKCRFFYLFEKTDGNSFEEKCNNIYNTKINLENIQSFKE